MRILAISLLSVRWDLRLMWSSLSLIAKLYLVGLSVISAFCLLTCARIIALSLRPLKGVSGPLAIHYDRSSGRIRFSQRLLILAFLMFGTVLANEVFGSLRAVELSYMSLSAISVTETLSVPTGLAFVVCSLFTFLYILLWFVESRLETLGQSQ
jgi:hypothetical protein